MRESKMLDFPKDYCLPPLIKQEQLKAKIHELGQQISQDYQGKEILCIGVLNGAVQFLVHLIEEIKLPLNIDFISVSSYGNSTQSSGQISWRLKLLQDISNKHVIIVEDIVDTGITLSEVKKEFLKHKPKSLKIASLFSKPSRREVKVDIDYLGFEIENHYVVGFGFDYQGYYRNLPHVAILPEDRYK
ncbi:hypoxanthine phosphoribosyltransferase [bacterium]|nr:hypoxanthine phosphoribosyltransferase [bacterium]